MKDPDGEAEIVGVVGHVKQWALSEDLPSEDAAAASCRTLFPEHAAGGWRDALARSRRETWSCAVMGPPQWCWPLCAAPTPK